MVEAQTTEMLFALKDSDPLRLRDGNRLLLISFDRANEGKQGGERKHPLTLGLAIGWDRFPHSL
jgi:hypothetical protein